MYGSIQFMHPEIMTKRNKMKYIKLTIFIIVLISINGRLKSQETVDVNIHLNKEIVSQSQFLLTYEFSGKEKRANVNTIFETHLAVTLISSKKDTFHYQIKSHSKKCSNPEILKDGEAIIIYSIFGAQMDVLCDAKGQLIEVLNKTEIIHELLNPSQNQYKGKIERWVENMKKENEAMLFESLYKINYEPLLKYSMIKKIIPAKTETDSIMAAASGNPEFHIKTIEENYKTDNHLEFKVHTTMNSKELVEKKGLYESIIKPTKSTITEILTTDHNGYVHNLAIITQTTREGMIMKTEGRTLSDTGPFSENMKLTYARIGKNE